MVIRRLGRVVWVTHPSEPETETGYFDDDAAQAGLEVMRRQWLADGWVEQHDAPPPQPPVIEEWVAEPDAVLQRLGGVMTSAAASLLEPLLRHGALSVEGGDLLHCELPDGDTLRFTVGGQVDPRTPGPLASFLNVCGLELGEVGETGQLVLHDGFRGTLHAIGRDLWPEAPFSYSKALCSPIDLNLGAAYVIDPRNGQLCFLDEGPLRVADTPDPVEIYFREVHLRYKTYQPTTPLERAVSAMTERHTWLSELR